MDRLVAPGAVALALVPLLLVTGAVGELPQETPAALPPPAAAPAARPNLLLVTMDTTRADHLGCYGYSRPTTPQIDAFAREAIVFENCYSALTHTTPSHTSIFTGVFPFEHGVLACSFRAPDDVQASRAFTPTPALRHYAEILQSHGWSTGGFVTAATTKKITGLGIGFDVFHEPDSEVRPGAEATAEALSWLETAKEPLFVWAHYFDAHVPPREKYTRVPDDLAPDPKLRAVMAQRKMGSGGGRATSQRQQELERDIARYDTGLRLIDDHFAAIRAKLEARGAWDRTTVVIVGDHGEGLGQHNFIQHGPVWREGTHVPFLLRVPGRAPERIATVVSTVDALLTAAAATPGLPVDELRAQASGFDVLAPDFEERPVFSMSPPTRGEYSLSTTRWRYIHRSSGKHALYDLAADPFELVDVQKKYPDVAAGLDRQLLERIREQRQRNLEIYGGERHGTRLTRDAEEQLRAELSKLGYTDEGEAGDRGAHDHDDGESPVEDDDAGGSGDEANDDGDEAEPGDGARHSGA